MASRDLTKVQKVNRFLRKVPAWPIYIGMLAWFAWLFWLGATGQTGPEPIKSLEHSLGDAAIRLFILVLAITPLRTFTDLALFKYRRALGLAVFFFVFTHLGVWLFLDVQIASQIWADILKRPYITIGMASFVMLIPMAMTSNNWSVRRLGSQIWNRIHMLGYPAALLGAIHNVMIQKVWEFESTFYLVLIILLLALRLPKFLPRLQARRA